MIAWIRSKLVPQRALGLSLALLAVRVVLGGGLVIAGQGKIAKLQGKCATSPLPECEKEAKSGCGTDADCLANVGANCEKERAQSCADDAAKTVAWFEGLKLCGRDDWKLPGGGRLNLALAAGQEVVFGALVLVGLLARFAAGPLVAVMAVAMASAHWTTFNHQFDFTSEVAMAYLTMAMVIAATGPGLLSVDVLWASKGGGAAPKPKAKAQA